MKKILYILIALLLAAGVCFAGSPHLKVLARINADTTSCPDWYADTNVVFSWDPNHDSGTNYGCESDGSAYAMTATGSPQINSNGLRIDTANQYLVSPGSQSIIDNSASQTVCMVLHITDVPTDRIELFEGSDGSDDKIILKVDTNVTPRLHTTWDTQADTAIYGYGEFFTVDTDYTVGFSWNVSTNRTSANPGDNGTWDSGWDEGGDTANSMTTQADWFTIGNRSTSVPDSSEYVYIKKFAIVTGYEQDCDALTNF